MPDQTISKTDFLVFCECPKHFWAVKHGYPSAEPLTAMDQFRMQQGQQVEQLALDFIEQHILPRYAHAQLLWQHTATHDGFLARSDVLIFDETADEYDLYEIKSSTSVHKEHLPDAAFQCEVFSNTLRIRNVYIVHLNAEYRIQEALDLAELFRCEDITGQVMELQPSIALLMQAARQALQLDSHDTLEHCRKPDTCPFPDVCHPDLPDHPIYEISRLHKTKAILLEEMGVQAIQEIPPDFKLSEKQQAYVDVVKEETAYIDREAIRNWCAQLCYPLYFLDYETCNPALPVFKGYKPNQHIVFQYSLHVLSIPDGELKHVEYIHPDWSDPAPVLLDHLMQHITPGGSVIVWNKGFECSRNNELAEIHTGYAQFLEGVNGHAVDLMEVFSQGMYIHPDFHGSASIKKVLPVLVPELNYNVLAIQKGDEASIVWWEMVQGEIASQEKQATINSLLQYCELDTLAMVRIYLTLTKLLAG